MGIYETKKPKINSVDLGVCVCVNSHGYAWLWPLLPQASLWFGKISIVFEDLSRNSVSEVPTPTPLLTPLPPLDTFADYVG
mgnify:CR=1 FL=1